MPLVAGVPLTAPLASDPWPMPLYEEEGVRRGQWDAP